MISFMAIGFGLLGIAVSLATLQNDLRREGNVQEATIKQVRKAGLILCIVGLLVILIGIFSPLLISEARILMGTGASLMYAGLLSLIQWVVYKRKGNVHQVGIGKWVVAYSGFGLIIVYLILRFFGLQF